MTPALDPIPTAHCRACGDDHLLRDRDQRDDGQTVCPACGGRGFDL